MSPIPALKCEITCPTMGIIYDPDAFEPSQPSHSRVISNAVVPNLVAFLLINMIQVTSLPSKTLPGKEPSTVMKRRRSGWKKGNAARMENERSKNREKVRC
jgi:hypothetical protein